MRRNLVSLAVLAGIVALPQIAAAQQSPAKSGLVMMSAMVPAKQGCSALAWNIVRTPATGGATEVSGIAWWVDGTGFSSVRGVESTDGEFSSQVTVISGNGPSGAVTGRRNSDGSVDFTMVGRGCSNVTVHAAPGQTTSG